MRGGALFILFWAAMLTLSLIGCWIVTDDGIQVAEFAVGVGIVLLFAGAYAARSREAIQRGAPGLDASPEALPEASLATVGLAIGLASTLFGLVWATFLFLFGIGLMAFSAGRLVLELRAQRSSRRLVSEAISPRRRGETSGARHSEARS